MEFVGRLASLVPRPRANLTRFHGVFSPNSKLRKQIVPENSIQVAEGDPVNGEPEAKRYGLYWAQRLRRVFNIEVEECAKCGGRMKVIVETSNRCLEEPDLVEKILKHLGLDEAATPHSRSPPQVAHGILDQTVTTLF